MQWHQHWADIKGNFKWWLLTGAVVGLYAILADVWKTLGLLRLVALTCLFVSGWFYMIYNAIVEHRKAGRSHTLKPKAQQDSLRLYQGRTDTRPSLLALTKMADVIWIATHEATNLRGQGLLRHPLQRLILLQPDSLSVDLFSTVEGAQKDAKAISRDIELAINDAQKNGITVKTFDGPFNAVIIGNPTSNAGWAQIEPYFPWSEAHDRPSFFFKQSDYPECFKRLVDSFNEMWDRRPAPTVPLDRSTIGSLRAKNEELEASLSEYKRKLANLESESKNKTKRLYEFSQQINKLKNDLAYERILVLGMDTSGMRPKNLMVVVVYYDLQDAELAELIGKIFVEDHLNPSWRRSITRSMEHALPIPYGNPRIRITATDPKVKTALEYILNNSALLPLSERVGLDPAISIDDVVITIYPRKLSDD